MHDAPDPLVLFDGVCNLCNGAVNFIIDRDPRGIFRFASLQSAAARRALDALDRRADGGDSILLIDGGRVYDRSTAALRIARRLPRGWRLLGVLLVVPRPLRDAVYRMIASHRYRWFGRSDVCRVPDAALRNRFLDDAPRTPDDATVTSTS